MVYENQKVLVIGNGGREHALVWKLSQSDMVSEIFCLPGNVGMLNIPKTHFVSGVEIKNLEKIKEFATTKQINLVVVGPEEPLANGLCDVLHEFNVFGPSKHGAQIETNKDWAKAFMNRHHIPTASYKSFDDAEQAKEFIKNGHFDGYVVKASGLAAGKGVFVSQNKAEACDAVDTIMIKKKFGTSGNTVVIEEKLFGEEVSVCKKLDNTTNLCIYF